MMPNGGGRERLEPASNRSWHRRYDKSVMLSNLNRTWTRDWDIFSRHCVKSASHAAISPQNHALSTALL